MVTVAVEGAGREQLEQKFLAQHCPFAKGWSLERNGRQTRWTSPRGGRRVEVTLTPHEFKEPRDVAGLVGEALTWDEALYRRQGDEWMPAPVRVALLKQKPKTTLARGRRS